METEFTASFGIKVRVEDGNFFISRIDGREPYTRVGTLDAHAIGDYFEHLKNEEKEEA